MSSFKSPCLLNLLSVTPEGSVSLDFSPSRNNETEAEVKLTTLLSQDLLLVSFKQKILILIMIGSI